MKGVPLPCCIGFPCGRRPYPSFFIPADAAAPATAPTNGFSEAALAAIPARGVASVDRILVFFSPSSI